MDCVAAQMEDKRTTSDAGVCNRGGMLVRRSLAYLRLFCLCGKSRKTVIWPGLR